MLQQRLERLTAVLAKEVQANGVDHSRAAKKLPRSYPLGAGLYTAGLYTISMLVGKPLKAYPLDIDTGSDVTWILCSDLKARPRDKAVFDYRASNSTLVNCDVKKSPSSLCRDVQRSTGGDE
eukprot:jgi/Mesen1/9089/ME000058S08587